MSLIPLVAHRIRLAAADEDYEQELCDAVREGGEGFRTLVRARVRRQELAALTPIEWQWYASWRQALGGPLDAVVLNHLTDSGSTRFARYEVHKLVLRDPRTNADALEGDDLSNRPNAIGLNWLHRQATGARIIEDFDRIPDEELGGVFEQMPDEVFELMRDEALELMRDALQCATEASWFLLRRLTSLNDDRGRSVNEWLRDFVRSREIEPRIWERWGLREPLGR
jgi:hypothetical protein